jgi:putative peptidoglycan lipid II flippase
MSMVALSAGILNTWRRFAVPALTPVLLNLSIIGAAWWGAPAFAAWGIEPIKALAVGVMLGGLLQAAVQVPALLAIGCLPRFALRPRAFLEAWQHPGLGRVLSRMAPALLGVSVAQISLLINTQIATYVAVGAVSGRTYADRLMVFPTGLRGVALGGVLLPQLSSAQARQDAEEYYGMLDWGLRRGVVLARPCAVAPLVVPDALVAVVFQSGEFRPLDVTQTTRALMGYGVGLMGLVGVKVLAPGFYARQDTRTPVRIAVVVLIATQAMNALFVPWLGHAGLALSIGLGALLNAGWLLTGLRSLGVYRPRPGWTAFLLRVVLGCAALGAVLAWAARHFDWIGLQAQWGQRAATMAAVLAGVALLYFGVLLASGLRPSHLRRRA